MSFETIRRSDIFTKIFQRFAHCRAPLTVDSVPSCAGNYLVRLRDKDAQPSSFYDNQWIPGRDPLQKAPGASYIDAIRRITQRTTIGQ